MIDSTTTLRVNKNVSRTFIHNFHKYFAIFTFFFAFALFMKFATKPMSYSLLYLTRENGASCQSFLEVMEPTTRDK